jgi:hypothetical protein
MRSKRSGVMTAVPKLYTILGTSTYSMRRKRYYCSVLYILFLTAQKCDSDDSSSNRMKRFRRLRHSSNGIEPDSLRIAPQSDGYETLHVADSHVMTTLWEIENLENPEQTHKNNMNTEHNEQQVQQPIVFSSVRTSETRSIMQDNNDAIAIDRREKFQIQNPSLMSESVLFRRYPDDIVELERFLLSETEGIDDLSMSLSFIYF